jgi:hypothetical protein
MKLKRIGYFLAALLLMHTLFSCQKNKMSINAPKGYLVSVEELQMINEKAKAGIEPHSSNVILFINYIDSLMKGSTDWPALSGEIVIQNRSRREPVQLSFDGTRLVYGTAIAWHITGDEKYAKRCKELILDLTDTYGFRNAEHDEFHWGAQGILNLTNVILYINAADLLESWQGWLEVDKLDFQIWLRDIVYEKVAWASRTRKNNWGVFGSYACATIAYYLMGHPDWKLEESFPYQQKLSPQEAYDSHNAYQIGRQRTSEEWRMDAKTFIWGILPNGGIPEEIRRGDDPVDGEYLPTFGSGTHYTQAYIEALTAHAEFLHRRGDNSLYDNIFEDGSGSLLQAYLFVIDNPLGSHCFTASRINAIYIAYNYYKHPALLKSIKECGPSDIHGRCMSLFGRLTHPIDLSR